MISIKTIGAAVVGAAAIGVGISSVQVVNAATISDYTMGTETAAFTPGQSVTTPNSSTPWNNITFNWFSDPLATTPTAFGDLFLLSQEYLGLPTDLSSSTNGFIAQSMSILGGKYIFDSEVVLQANTQYFFYANAGGLLSGISSGTYEGGNLYSNLASQDGSFVSLPPQDANFRLSGTPIPTPALLPGLIGMGVAALRKKGQEESAEQEA